MPESEKLEQEALGIQLRVFGPEHLGTLSSMNNLANTLMLMRRDAEAEKLLRQTLDIERRVLGPEQPETALCIYNRACIAARRGQSEEALSFLRQAIDHGLAPRVDLVIEKEPDFNPLHGDPRFGALVADAKQHATPAGKPN